MLDDIKAMIAKIRDHDIVISKIEFHENQRQSLVDMAGESVFNTYFLLSYYDDAGVSQLKFVNETFLGEKDSVKGNYLAPIRFVDDPDMPAKQAKIYRNKRMDAPFPFIDLIKEPEYLKTQFVGVDDLSFPMPNFIPEPKVQPIAERPPKLARLIEYPRC